MNASVPADHEIRPLKQFSESVSAPTVAAPVSLLAATEQLAAIAEASASASEAFYVNDLAAPGAQYRRFVAAMPRVTPFYAVKCCDDARLVAELAALGTGFDCASLAELQQVIALGVAPERIIHANPCKREAAIHYSRAVGVSRMTYDSMGELDKIAALYPAAELVLRVHADDSRSLVRLGAKFGCARADIGPLIARALELGLAVVGVSFHVGSGCLDPAAFSDAIVLARHAFDVAAALGVTMTLLDIGGGFPGTPKANDALCPLAPVAYRAHGAGTSQCPAVTFEAIADAVNATLSEVFSPLDFPALTIIAEPGRFFAQTFSTLVVKVFGRRVMDGVQYLHADTGVYGGLNNLIFDNAKPVAYRLSTLAAGSMIAAQDEPVPMLKTTIWGPTCDSMDVVAKEVPFPEIATGEWLVYFQQGAYGIIAASYFNGIAPPAPKYMRSRQPAPIDSGSSVSSEDEAH